MSKAHDVIWTVTCPFCGESEILTLPLEGFLDWRNGTPVQEAFPDLSVDDRERLISGICPDCWDEMFKDE